VSPWWVAEVRALLSAGAPAALTLAQLWSQAVRWTFLRENVASTLLLQDFVQDPAVEPLWNAALVHEPLVHSALKQRREELFARMRAGTLEAAAFRKLWDMEGDDADLFLEGLFDIARLTVGEPTPHLGHVNIASRAARISEFLEEVAPGASDTVYDLGSGNGKFALTVAASTCAQVKGVELGGGYVDHARECAARMGLRNAEFFCSDVRGMDFADGTVFYLFHPFHGDAARAVAESLATLARTKPVTVYLQGPEEGFAQYWLAEEKRGAFRLCDPQGRHVDVRVFRST